MSTTDAAPDYYARCLAWYLGLRRTTWRPEGAEHVIPLEELDSGHRQNLLDWLDARAVPIVDMAFWGSAKYWSWELSQPHGDMAEYALESASDAECDEMLADPIGWLHRTPLYARLAELVAADRAAVALPDRPAGAPAPRLIPLEV